MYFLATSEKFSKGGIADYRDTTTNFSTNLASTVEMALYRTASEINDFSRDFFIKNIDITSFRVLINRL